MKKRRKRLRYIRFFLEPWRSIARRFDAETLGKLFVAALRYADAGEDPNFPKDSALQSMWLFCRDQLRRDIARHGRQE